MGPLAFIGWIGLAVAVGFWADSKGKEGGVWGLIALLISPLLAAIILFFIGLRDDRIAKERADYAMESRRVAEEKKAAEKEEKARRTTVSAETFFVEIQKLHALRINEVLTEDEYRSRKMGLIVELSMKKTKESGADFLTAMLPLMKNAALDASEVADIKKYVL